MKHDLEQVKKIYLNADRGSWIKVRMRQFGWVTYVLDRFHLEKYLLKLVLYMKKETQRKELEEIRGIIRNKTKEEFREFVEKQKREMPAWKKREVWMRHPNIYIIKLESNQAVSETWRRDTGKQYRKSCDICH